MSTRHRHHSWRFSAFATAIGPREVAALARTVPSPGDRRAGADPPVGGAGARKESAMTTTSTPSRPATALSTASASGTPTRAARRGPTILLTSPWPESLYAFAPVWETLAAHARLFAVDLPGFGRSERRDDLMSPRAMGDFLARLVDEAELGRPYVVGPDVGTAGRPVRRRRRTRTSSPAWSSAAAAPRTRCSWANRWRPGSSTRTSTGTARSTRTLVVNTAVDNHAGDVPDDIRADYLASYEGDRFVESMRYVRRYPEELPVLAELLPRSASPGHRRQRPARPRRTAGQRRLRRRPGAQRPHASSSTPATSSGRRSPTSTPRPCSRRRGRRIEGSEIGARFGSPLGDGGLERSVIMLVEVGMGLGERRDRIVELGRGAEVCPDRDPVASACMGSRECPGTDAVVDLHPRGDHPLDRCGELPVPRHRRR